MSPLRPDMPLSILNSIQYPLVLVVLTLFSLVLYEFATDLQYPKPPGPRGLPILGNIFQFPKEKEWLTYAAWAGKYGVYDVYTSVTGLCRTDVVD